MTDIDAGIRVRQYGATGPYVIVVHGGPGAAGYMSPVARLLGERFRVFEPLQRRSEGEPLTVARHVNDLRQVIETCCADGKPAIVGHSWGAMLALAYGAAHPGKVGSLILIGCGTFDQTAREHMANVLEERIDSSVREMIDRLRESVEDPDERLKRTGEILLPVYSYRLAGAGLETEYCDARGHEETWEDMLRLQESGIYPSAFSAIHSPTIMLHGAVDPHPGEMIRKSLGPYIPHLEYLEWKNCGHYPWLEEEVRDGFYFVLSNWLQEHAYGVGAR